MFVCICGTLLNYIAELILDYELASSPVIGMVYD